MTHQDGMWNSAVEKSSGWTPVWFLCCLWFLGFFNEQGFRWGHKVTAFIGFKPTGGFIRWSVRPNEPQFADNIKNFMASKMA